MTTPFSDLDQYAALPRVDGIAVSPDGTRVALTVSVLDDERTGYRRSIWSVPGPVDPTAGAAGTATPRSSGSCRPPAAKAVR